MSLHINKFLDLVNSAEAKGQKDVYLSLRDAKNLHNDLTRLLLVMEDLRNQATAASDVIRIDVNGGGFKDP